MSYETTVQEAPVQCPHCLVGRIVAYIEQRGDASHVHGMREPQQCPSCHGWVRFHIQFHLSAVPAPDGHGRQPSGAILRHALGSPA